MAEIDCCFAPSLLGCDPLYYGAGIKKAVEAGAAALHIDVMDGHFVPSLGFSARETAAFHEACVLPLDVHLMTFEPRLFVKAFARSGASSIVFHFEASQDPYGLLKYIKAQGVRGGVAISPATPAEALGSIYAECDLITVMSVPPGEAGATFIPGTLEKLRRLRAMTGPGTEISVDGGVTPEIAKQCVRAGATKLIMGSSFFKC